MKILVTGANGYLGRGIVSSLLDKGAEVVAADFNVDSVDKRATRVAVDLFSIDTPYVFFDSPDVVLHLAWRNGFVHNASSHIKDLPQHIEFIEKLSKTPVSRIAIMGSMHEIGYHEGVVEAETPCFPQSFYGIAKNAFRDATKLICENAGKKFQWLRAFYIVSAASNGSSIFSKIVQAAERNEKEFPFTSGQSAYDFLDYSDFCSMVSACVCQESVLGIVNICSGTPTKLADRVERFISENGLRIQLKYGAYPDRPYDSNAIWGDATKINSILGQDLRQNEM